MKLATFEYQGKVGVGVVSSDFVARIESAPDMLTLIEQGTAKLKVVRETIPLAQVKLLAPIPRPRKNIFAIGRNYADHAKESADARGEKAGPPVIFTKAPTTVNAPFGEIVVDPEVSTQIDWEAELAVIIGKRARKIKQAAALNYVFGYTVLNDVTARDLQNRTSQFFVGKSIDGYCADGSVDRDRRRNSRSTKSRCIVPGERRRQTGGQHARDDVYRCLHPRVFVEFDDAGTRGHYHDRDTRRRWLCAQTTRVFETGGCAGN